MGDADLQYDEVVVGVVVEATVVAMDGGDAMHGGVVVVAKAAVVVVDGGDAVVDRVRTAAPTKEFLVASASQRQMEKDSLTTLLSCKLITKNQSVK